MVCIYWAKRRTTKANLDTIIIPFAEAGKTVVIVDDDEPLVHIEIPHPSVTSRLHRQVVNRR
jgi:hypothetical protein